MNKMQLFYEDDLAIFFYYSKKSIKEEIVDVKNLNIFFPGLPQYIDHRFFENYVDQDNAFMQVFYYGSWLSGKSFSYNNCLKTVMKALELARRKHALKTFDNEDLSWNFSRLNILAYSFSGNIILKSLSKLNNVYKIILLAPMAYISRTDTKNILDEQESSSFYGFNNYYHKFLARGYLNTYRDISKIDWKNFFDGKLSASKITQPKNTPQNITIFYGANDSSVPIKFINKVKNDFSANLIKVSNAGHDIYELFKFGNIFSLINSPATYSKKSFDSFLKIIQGKSESLESDKIEGVVFEINRDQVENKIKNAGAALTVNCIQKILTFDLPDSSLKANNIILRTKTNNNSSVLQYKKIDYPTNKHVRIEKEVLFSVPNISELLDKIKKYGLVQTGVQERKLSCYTKVDIAYNLITWPNTPTYLGVEAKNFNQLLKAVEDLGINIKKVKQIGGVEIFKKYNLNLNNLTFKTKRGKK